MGFAGAPLTFNFTTLAKHCFIDLVNTVWFCSLRSTQGKVLALSKFSRYNKTTPIQRRAALSIQQGSSFHYENTLSLVITHIFCAPIVG
jgi:hypothetical protein